MVRESFVKAYGSDGVRGISRHARAIEGKLDASWW